MAQATSNAAKAVLMPMRLKIPHDFPNIGKFSDVIDWNQLGAPKMYFKEEELKEEEVGEVVKDADYYKKRRNQRRSYRKKNLLLFEDDTYPLPGGLKYNGQLANTTLAELEATQLNKHSAIENDEAPFKYALLQFTKKDNGENEINIIPVGDMFLFKKAPKASDELLADIEAKFENERLRIKDRHEKYKGIYNSLVNAEKARLKAEGADAEEYSGGFESTSLFSKAFGKKKSKSVGSLGGGGTQTYINENGIDVDDLKEHDWCQGDYTSRYADDEEDNIVVEQISNNQYEDQEISASLRYDEEDVADSDEEQEEEKKEEDPDEEVGMVDESMVSSAAEARKMLNLSNLHKQVQLDKQAQLAAINAAANAAVAAETKDNGGSSSSGSGSGTGGAAAAAGTGGGDAKVNKGMKRSRVSFEDSAAVTAAGAAGAVAATSDANSAAAAAAGGDAKKNRASLSGTDSAATQSVAGSEYSFNEDGVRKFIQHKGGKVLTSVLLEFFKPMIKSYRDDQGKKAGKDRFLSIVKDATVTMEDPVLGTVLTVKQ